MISIIITFIVLAIVIMTVSLGNNNITQKLGAIKQLFTAAGNTAEVRSSTNNLNPPVITITKGAVDFESIAVTVNATDTIAGMSSTPTYEYYIKQSSEISYPVNPITSNSANYTFTGLERNTNYDVKVRAANKAGKDGETEIQICTARPMLYKDGKKLKESTTTTHETIKGTDKLGNKVTLPGGFKIAEASDETVEEGIIIEDDIGNQFVWVPVSNINGDGVVGNQSANGLITKKDGSKVQITLGRYTFAREKNDITGNYEDGTPTLVQKGSEYANENTGNKYTIDSYFTELTTFRESNYTNDLTGTNATAYNLQGFIESVRDNHGYYIARYEASYGSGSTVADYKPLSQKSTANSTERMKYTKGTLWNYITQGDASKVSRNMYAGNSYVESDLVNSYMWDTAIVYIQAMGNENYANATRGSNKSLKNTGKTGDEKCHIFDMAGNTLEWTTENSTSTTSSSAYPCTRRGGSYDNNYIYVADHHLSAATNGLYYVGFRTTFYVK